MVDVGDKAKTERVAVATARLRMLPATRERILAGKVEKGDVLAAARLAGIMAAKRTPDFVPLCHPIALAGVEVTLTPEEAGLSVRARVKTVDRTGVEMEALTAACAAALTVYDMCKSVDRGMVLEAVQLEHKAGGRSGTWNRDAEGPGETTAPRARTGKRKGGAEGARPAAKKRGGTAEGTRPAPASSASGGRRGKRPGEAEGLREALVTVVTAGKRAKRGG